MPAKLSVNLNAIAMLRNRRDLPWPSVIGLGRIALAAGASGLTVHPRPDQRHVRFSDLPEIRALIDDEFPEAEFNIEGYPSDEFFDLCASAEPEQVTLVPDDPSQATSDHGWDFRKNRDLLVDVVAQYKKIGCRVSLFADGDGDAEAVKIARDVGAALFRGGKYSAAREVFLTLVQNDPNDARLWYFAALANGVTSGAWTGETEVMVRRGLACEQRGRPKRSDIDAQFSTLTKETGKDWLGEWRKSASQ